MGERIDGLAVRWVGTINPSLTREPVAEKDPTGAANGKRITEQ